MRDIYLYEDCDVLKNLLGIKDTKTRGGGVKK